MAAKRKPGEKFRRPNQNNRNTGRSSGNGKGGDDDPDDDDDDPDDDDDDRDDQNDDDDEDDDDLFTQDDVNKIVGRERAKATRAAAKQLAKELGFDSVEAMKAALASKKTDPKPKAKEKDDEDDTTPSAEEIRAQMEAEHAKQLAEVKLTDKIKDMLVDDFGLSRKAAAKVRRMVDLDVDATDDEIEEALEDIESEFPEMFRQGSGDDDQEGDDDERQLRSRSSRNRRQPVRRHSDPGRSGRGRKPVNVEAAARTLLHERHPQTKTKK